MSLRSIVLLVAGTAALVTPCCVRWARVPEKQLRPNITALEKLGDAFVKASKTCQENPRQFAPSYPPPPQISLKRPTSNETRACRQMLVDKAAAMKVGEDIAKLPKHLDPFAVYKLAEQKFHNAVLDLRGNEPITLSTSGFGFIGPLSEMNPEYYQHFIVDAVNIGHIGTEIYSGVPVEKAVADINLDRVYKPM